MAGVVLTIVTLAGEASSHKTVQKNRAGTHAPPDHTHTNFGRCGLEVHPEAKPNHPRRHDLADVVGVGGVLLTL